MPALVLVAVDQTRDPTHGVGVETLLLELGDREVAFHVALDDRVEHGVLGQRVGVLLVGTELGARRLLEHDFGDERAAGALVAIARERVHEHLRHVLDHRERAGHVGAVQRGVAGCHLALVPRGEHEATELVAQRHEHRAADARLEVLPGQPGIVPERLGQHVEERGVRGLDRDRHRPDAEVGGERLRRR